MSVSGLDLNLDGRNALVTGGAGGLGLACARALRDCGAAVVLADLPGDRLDRAAAELGVSAIGADLSIPAECERLPEAAGDPSILVNAVGVMRTRPFAEVDATAWQRTLDVNLTGVFHTTRAAAARMTQGSIITLSSVAGRSGRPNAADYAATKAALLSLTKSAALALAPAIRVNAVCPGVFMTDMWSGIIADRDREFGEGAGRRYLDEVAERTPLRRIGTPAELAAVVAFLASDLARFVTGQAINVDGGLEMD